MTWIPSRNPVAALFFALLWLVSESALANKFQTISGGVVGSNRIKIEYIRDIAWVAGGILLVAAILSILTHNRNAHSVNYTMWRASTLVFSLLSLLAFATALFV